MEEQQLEPVRVVLPLRLVSEANLRQHWAVKAERAAAQRGATKLALYRHLRAFRRSLRLLEASLPPKTRPGANVAQQTPSTVVVRITRIAPRMLDGDNCVSSCKHVRDGVADALDVNDRTSLVRWEYHQGKSDKPKTYEVEIEVTTVAA